MQIVDRYQPADAFEGALLKLLDKQKRLEDKEKELKAMERNRISSATIDGELGPNFVIERISHKMDDDDIKALKA